jgi:hypothetical protein
MDQLNKLNEAFIELELKLIRELIPFMDAHKPTPTKRKKS